MSFPVIQQTTGFKWRIHDHLTDNVSSRPSERGLCKIEILKCAHVEMNRIIEMYMIDAAPNELGLGSI